MKLMNTCIVLASFTSLLLTTVTDSFSSHRQMTIGFSSHRHHHHPAVINPATIYPLMMTPRPLSQSQSQLQQSRRDILLATFSSTAATAAAVTALVMTPTAVEAAPSKAAPAVTYEGFYVDPKNPDGLRLLRKKTETDVSVSGSTAFDAIMTKSDGVMKEMTRGNITAVEMVYEDIPVSVKGNELTFDITIKGGPTESLVGKLSGDGTKLTFPDGNIWTKK
mmetsp:Transcript_26319/g.29931  ORF Transcript_26319/g.29931 Transcript_26319/m.29931 type:complete len:221 (+) Transcript_26319:61-723(+)